MTRRAGDETPACYDRSVRIALLALVAAASSAGCSFLFDPGNPGDPIDSGVHFAFAWLAFNPESEIYGR